MSAEINSNGNSNRGTQTSTTPLMTGRLSMMMFLQFFTWGAWFATMGLALSTNNLGTFIGGAYETAPIAAIFAPLFLGLVADRFFSSEKIFGTLMLVGGIIMMLIPGIGDSATEHARKSMETLKTSNVHANADELTKAFNEDQAKNNSAGKLLVWLILAYMLCYMPTLGLGNTIAFTHIPSQDKFPLIRVWGTIGWIVAGLLIGITAWDAQYLIFWLGGISSLVLGVYCFTLPSTPPPLKGTPMNLRSIFMLDAFKLLSNWNFLVFAICSMLVCIPLAYYYGSTSQFLGQTGFQATGATMTLGQMSEIFFMLLIPVFFRKLGVKVMILIGIACWVIRYLLFAFGAPDQVTWMLLLGVLLHGICYDFFFVTGFMYTDQKAPVEIRGQAQGLLVFLTQGIGMFFGYRIMAGGSLFGIPLNLTIGKYGEQVTKSPEYTEALAATRSETGMSFLETFSNMVSRSLPETLDKSLLAETMQQWQNFWMLPAIMASVVFLIFLFLFWDKTHVKEQ
ncbi:MAG TPA: nucleoside permease [Pirellulaceae bacterium]|nr:nucleoside permease [Pirellulaceae bacterium]HMP67714.1 nucleoside permease [Pirellulaceae bacterium]